MFYVFMVFGVKLFPAFGLLVPLGYTEGPGQALSYGKVWEEFGFSHAATLGLTFAAVGFLFALFVGVPLVNWGIRKTRRIEGKEELPQDLLKGLIPKEQERKPAGALTTHSSNIDTMTFQTALIGVVYLLTYTFVFLIGRLLDAETAKILWGFFFFCGLGIAMGVGGLMKKLGVAHYVDPGVQRRITGWAIDFLIVATLMAIQIVVVWQFIVPIIVMSLLAGITTFMILVFFGRRLYGLNLERMAFIYGACTGTVSSGLLLLRIVDPQLKTPVALEAGMMSILAVPIIGPCLILVNAYFLWKWEIWLVALVFIGILVICLVLLKLFKYWGEPKF
jgi:ESS family glutamate:Na+ symporter